MLYGDEGIEHRLRDSQARVLVTNSANRDRIADGLVEEVLVLDEGLEGGALARWAERQRQRNHSEDKQDASHGSPRGSTSAPPGL